ncbi:hypothetical protein Tsubulata_036299 [Turnera subulata]|uniref:TF-B3 domain-containing protein n=1 Tax=Turnera subulata TaxID=218843 RepID=A0A9Q0GCY5_9ROSI|nr:hypothetical protein Tsubulata_036299 [Turnera subulata]
MERAEELRASLDPSLPSFAKALVRSNVTVGFWMHLPMRFCKLYLPKNDTTVFLETESKEEFITNYIAERTALSGGWKAFCAGNNLHEGDVLVFHLLKPLRFKVYVVRGDDSANVEIAVQYVDAEGRQINSEFLNLMCSLPSDDKNQAEKDTKSRKKGKHLEIVPVSTFEEKNEEKSLIVSDTSKGHVAKQPENDEERSSETPEVTRTSELSVDFKDIQGIENFGIHVNGFAIDSELTEHHRNKYYELCSSQNCFLHDNLLNSINYKLAAEIIIETVNISESIRSSRLSSSRADYSVWDKTLKGFELLGMNVGFLRARLNKLMTLAVESEEAMEAECREVRMEQARVKEEMVSLEMKLLKLKESREKLDAEIEVLKENAEKHEYMFQEVAKQQRSPEKNTGKKPSALCRIANNQAKRKGSQKNNTRTKSLALCTITSNKVSSIVPFKSESHKRKRVGSDNLHNESMMMEQARELQVTLSQEFPSLIKYMLHSHGLPKKFCDEYLPKEDTMITLEDENGKECATKYLAQKVGLSGGWRGFSIDHNIKEGDVAVFHLVKPTKFKVYILRADSYNDILNTADQEMEDQDFDRLVTNEFKLEENEHPEHMTEDFDSEFLGGIRLAESVVEFKDVKGFKDFDIVVNGLVINSELSKNLQAKYYELCCSQKSYLHDHLIDGLNCNLVVGVIAQIVLIADSIKCSMLHISKENLAKWKVTLTCFAKLGMNVGFLMDQLESRNAKSKKYMEAKQERVRAEEELRSLEARTAEVKERIKSLDYEIVQLER